MADRKQLGFFLIRYAPDAIKEEFVNIGLVVLGDTGNAVRFTSDYRRVRCLDPTADLDMLRALEAELRARLAQAGSNPDAMLKLLHDSFSNTLQLSPVKACLAESVEQEADRLAEMYLETRRPARGREAAGRQLILGRMRDAFSQAGVWKLMSHQIRAAEFTHKGDPLKIDCGYRPNGILKMFHAVSLATDLDSAKVLAFTFPLIRDGMARTQKLDAALTAVVEDDLDRADESIAFALDTFSRTSIAVASAAELPRLAEMARRELRV